MKKLLLLSIIVATGVSLFAQNHYTKPQNPVKVQNVEMTPDGYTTMNGYPIIGEKRPNEASEVGITYYDLQSYVNIMSRIWEFDDGTVGAIWMAAGENLSPNRGTGYNYYDGSDWDEPLMHLGDDERTGWPSYAPWGENGEVIAHYWYPGDEPGPIRICTRETKGEGEWTMNTLYGPDDLSLVWHSILTSGENHEYIHLLARTYDAPYMGQDNALLYYRSSDGGESWDIEAELIEGLGEDYRGNSATLEYMWAKPVGNTIAFCYGFDQFGGQIFKSTDNGDSWEVIDAYIPVLDPLEPPVNSGIIPCGDGACAIALDSQGKAHVAFGKKLVVYQDTTMYWYPMSTEGIIYWNEDMDPLDTAVISSYTNDYLVAGGNLIGWLLPDATGSYDILDEQQFYGNQCMTSFPQLGIDENDDLFLVYTAIAPGYNNGTNNFRHIHINASYDGGNTWTGPFDVTSDISYWLSECVYPAISLNVKNKIHIMFQMDELPGIHEWLNNHVAVENQMIHLEFEKDEFVGLPETKKTNEPVVSQNYPNPATDATLIGIKLRKASSVSIDIINLTGQLIKTIDLGYINAGMTTATVDLSSIRAGVYYYTVNAGDEKITNKMIVR